MLHFQQIRCLAGAVAVMARPEIMAVKRLKGNRAGVDVCVLGQLSKILSHRPDGGAAPLAALVVCLLLFNSRRLSRLATGAAALAGSI